MTCPRPERIVTKNQTITPIEYWVSFALVRINLAGLLMALYAGLSGIVGLSSINEAGDKVHSLNLWIVFAAF